MTILEQLDSMNSRVSFKHFQDGTLRSMINDGIFGLIICLGDTAVSPLVVSQCRAQNIPLASVKDGLCGLNDHAKNGDFSTEVIEVLAELPLIAFTVYEDNVQRYYRPAYEYFKSKPNVIYRSSDKLPNEIRWRYGLFINNVNG